jgi:flavin-dependent dehydrogenase
MGEEGVRRVLESAWRNPLAAFGIAAAIISGTFAATTIYIKIDQVGEEVAKMNASTTRRLDELEKDKSTVQVQLGKIERDQSWMAKTLERMAGAPTPARGPQ